MGFVDVVVNFYDKWFTEGIVLNLFVAIMILLFGFLLGRFLGILLTKFLHEIELNKILKNAGIKIPLERPLGTIASYVIYLSAVIMALNQFKLTTYVLYTVVIVLVVLAILSVLLAIKDFFPNFFAGISIYRKGEFAVGDLIKVDTAEGRVLSVNLLETRLETSGGETISVPNCVVAKSKIKKLKKLKKK
ncbi:mechanosensitive ion channel family protein [Candidatus Woesearchaeota archaeon]|nr:mechanosensitive ion channel family protein [Candidatus Woesearchaeota archaeon]